MLFEFDPKMEQKAKLKVIGVGGAGGGPAARRGGGERDGKQPGHRAPSPGHLEGGGGGGVASRGGK